MCSYFFILYVLFLHSRIAFWKNLDAKHTINFEQPYHMFCLPDWKKIVCIGQIIWKSTAPGMCNINVMAIWYTLGKMDWCHICWIWVNNKSDKIGIAVQVIYIFRFANGSLNFLYLMTCLSCKDIVWYDLRMYCIDRHNILCIFHSLYD